MRVLWLIVLLLALAGEALAQGREREAREPREPRLRGTGTGFAVSGDGHVLTNAHVVRGCRVLRLRRPDDSLLDAQLVAASRRDDLALLKTEDAAASVAPFRTGRRLRPGDAVVAFGFPLAGTLSRSGNLTIGHVSALAGMGDDERFLQISTPIQPGNSGGPLLDMNGRVVGITTASLGSRRDAMQLQNVNFAVKGEVAQAFLARNGVAVETEGGSKRAMKPADVGARARRFTLRVECLA